MTTKTKTVSQITKDTPVLHK